MFDSIGRLTSGLTSGTIFNLIGNYDQCLSYLPAGNSSGNISGTQYCLAQIDLSRCSQQLAVLLNQPESAFTSSKSIGRLANFGLCAPSSCTTSDIKSVANYMFQIFISSSLSIQQLVCTRKEAYQHIDKQSLDNDDMVHVTVGNEINFPLNSSLLILFFVILCISTTWLDFRRGKRKRSSAKINWMIKSFSLVRNFRYLVGKHSNNHLNLKAVDVLRVTSMLWIITIHSYNFAIQWLFFDNFNKVNDVYKSGWLQPIANGTYSVDNFFLISGMLAWIKACNICNKNIKTTASTNYITQTANANNKGNVFIGVSSIVAKYLRLIPMEMIVIMFSVDFLPQLTCGPNSKQTTMMFEQWCDQSQGWIWNLLMLQNFIKTSTMCFSHSWFVAVNFQLFVFIILMRYLFLKFTKLLLVLSIVIVQLVVASVIFIYQLPSAPLIPVNSIDKMIDYFSLLYIKPHYWLSSYIIGVLLAIYLLESRSFQTKFSSKQLLSVFVLIMLIFLYWPQFLSDTPINHLQAIVYALLSRPLWSFCTAFLIYSFVSNSKEGRLLKNTSRVKLNYNLRRAASSLDEIQNHSTSATTRIATTNESLLKVIDNVFCWHIWIPLSRLTYLAYLIHPVLMGVFYGSRVESYQFSHWLMLSFNLANIFLTYLAALVMFLFIELPTRSLIERTIWLLTLNKIKRQQRQSLANCGNESSNSISNRSGVLQFFRLLPKQSSAGKSSIAY